MFILDMREILILFVKVDDNGVYIFKCSVIKFYVYNEEGSRIFYKDGNGVWYVNIRDFKGYRKEIVLVNEIYEFKREYYISKSNFKFFRVIIIIKGYVEKELRFFYVVTYKWVNGVD